MKKAIKLIVYCFASVFLILFIINIVQMRLNDISKNYVSIMNSNADNILKCIESDNYIFYDYCQEYKVFENETVYLSGFTTRYYDLIINANEYCPQNVNITKKPKSESAIDFYWTIKIENTKISEIWTYNIPLDDTITLQHYNFEEQVKIIPKFKKDKFNYAIGYNNAIT